jgi:hypothetical protein
VSFSEAMIATNNTPGRGDRRRESRRHQRRRRGELAGPARAARRLDLTRAGHSPCTVTTSVLWRARTSHSRWKICCQVPSTGRPSATGTMSDGPSHVAWRWECPLPSCHASS